MTREPVSSRAVSSIGYDEDAETLEVEYTGGTVYRYRGISPAEYAALRGAASLGQALGPLRSRGVRVGAA